MQSREALGLEVSNEFDVRGMVGHSHAAECHC